MFPSKWGELKSDQKEKVSNGVEIISHLPATSYTSIKAVN
jgi:hypothetical protein